MTRRNVIHGDGYRLTLPNAADVPTFTRAVSRLERGAGLTRIEAVRRLADRCNIKVETP